MGHLRSGALHVNCPFAEPLYGELNDGGLSWQRALGDWWQDDKPWLCEAHQSVAVKQDDWPAWRRRRGVVVAGRLSVREGEQVAAWADRLGWPLIGDVLSQTGQPLPCADLWLGNARAVTELSEADIVIQFGASLTGKRLLQWQATCQPQEYWIVDSLHGRLDPAHHRGRRLVADIGEWLAQHPAEKRAPWAHDVQQLSALAQARADAMTHEFGEAQLARRLPQLLPEQGQLFLGNSLVVRLVDALARLPQGYPVWSNRGASGIDGLISTAAGVQRAKARPTLAIIGDLSALYDLNSLALLRQAPAPFVLLIVNNNGGQIFSLLPTPVNERERFYCMPQDVSFAQSAAMFGLSYHAPASWQALQAAMTRAWQHPGASIIELKVEDTAGTRTLQQLLAQVSQL